MSIRGEITTHCSINHSFQIHLNYKEIEQTKLPHWERAKLAEINLIIWLTRTAVPVKYSGTINNYYRKHRTKGGLAAKLRMFSQSLQSHKWASSETQTHSSLMDTSTSRRRLIGATTKLPAKPVRTTTFNFSLSHTKPNSKMPLPSWLTTRTRRMKRQRMAGRASSTRSRIPSTTKSWTSCACSFSSKRKAFKHWNLRMNSTETRTHSLKWSSTWRWSNWTNLLLRCRRKMKKLSGSTSRRKAELRQRSGSKSTNSAKTTRGSSACSSTRKNSNSSVGMLKTRVETLEFLRKAKSAGMSLKTTNRGLGQGQAPKPESTSNQSTATSPRSKIRKSNIWS